MDGWLRIGTQLDDSQLEKDLKKEEKKLEKFKKQQTKLLTQKEKIELDLSAYYKEQQLIKESTNEMLTRAQTEEQVNNVLDMENISLNSLNDKYSKQLKALDDVNNEIQDNNNQQQKLNDSIDEMNNKLKKNDFSSIEKNIKGVGKETSNVIKKVAKWSLAIFGIRAAYGFVRNMVSTLSQYNEKLATDIEYISFAMASALQPIIEKLVSLVYKLLNGINYIAQAWFGVNLFANATADAMKNTSSSAKDVKKSLAGFDEMNTVSSNSSNSSVSPSVDLSGIQGEVPGWLKWIADNKDAVIAGLAGIAGGLIAVHSGLSLIQGLGIGLILAGVVLLIEGIVNFIKDPSWNNFLTILQGIALIVAGIAILMGGWVVALVALGVAIVAYVIQNWETVKGILGVIGEWIYKNIVEPIIGFIQGLFDTIISIVKLWISFISAIFTTVISLITNPFIVAKDTIIGIFDGIKMFINGFVQVIKSLFNGDIKGVLNGFKTMFSGIMNSLWSIAKAPINLIIGGINSLIKGMNKIKFDVPDWVPGIGGKTFGFNIKQIPKLASGGIINLPGKGVPLGGAIGGEVSREGVIPLTDSQAMEELGSAIGRYITINLTNNTNLDGRTIARHQSIVQANRNFAMNR